MKTKLIRMLEAFMKDEYELDEVNIELAKLDAKGSEHRVRQLMQDAAN